MIKIGDKITIDFSNLEKAGRHSWDRWPKKGIVTAIDTYGKLLWYRDGVENWPMYRQYCRKLNEQLEFDFMQE